MSKLEEKPHQPQEGSAQMWTPSGQWQGAECTERGQRGSSGHLFASQSSQTGTRPLPLNQGCASLSRGASQHHPLLPFCKQPHRHTRICRVLTLMLLATAALTNPHPGYLSSPQTCGHDSEFIFWMSSQINIPATFPWGLKKTFQLIFPYHHTLPWRCLWGSYMVQLHIPSPHQERDCKRTFQLF